MGMAPKQSWLVGMICAVSKEDAPRSKRQQRVNSRTMRVFFLQSNDFWERFVVPLSPKVSHLPAETVKCLIVYQFPIPWPLLFADRFGNPER
jgi:hypothetical protein